MTDIVTFGEVLAEFMALETNQSLGAPGHFAGPFPGGAPAIFIDQAAKLGSGAAMVSCVGDDAFGRMLVERLAADGVDVSAIATRPDATTASAFVTYHDDGQRDFIFNIANGACAEIAPRQFDGVLAGCKLFHIAGTSLFSGHMIDLARQAADRVKAAGGRVSFDPNVRKETLARSGARQALTDLLSRTDILLPSDSELNLLVDIDDDEQAVERALALGVSEIAWKNGSHGCRYYDGATVTHHESFAVSEVDPTGAGDSFGATFCTLRTQGMAAADALVYANAAGATAVSRRGAMEGTSTRAELDAFIDSHG
ncbi:sugar kinase [Salinisphaera japonica]|uniref:Sugar kinase n=1 Tax=Salinisphaera japonica YTM-1 TaxID=1209778 RepID=A0A423PZV8_9GAMM|nr:sugar kinase [Salinisphaera japonica]ROO31138.1 sugar kinase [Salinisphaera japonica YTM-1]